MISNRQKRRYLEGENRKYGETLQSLPESEWPVNRPPGLAEVWRSSGFLLQVYTHEVAVRLTVLRTELRGGRWGENISWEELQRLKAECGRGDKCAVEVFPPDDAVVDVANMRHLWLVDPPPFMWGAKET